MRLFTTSLCAALALVGSLALPSSSADAGIGDLLVAPTRLILTNGRGAEVVLNNIGDEEATYRISAELRRMTPDGSLVEVDVPSESERIAQEMIFFAPRRVTLPPNQPQSIRIAARAPQGLPDGEYRVHLLFRAIPKPTPVEEGVTGEGVSFQLIPVYGVTIPVIVRFGKLAVQAGVSNVRLDREAASPTLLVDLARSGDSSTYGDLVISKPGAGTIAEARGIAVYPEIGHRTVRVPVSADYQGPLSGAVTVTYRARPSDGGEVIASADTVLN